MGPLDGADVVDELELLDELGSLDMLVEFDTSGVLDVLGVVSLLLMVLVGNIGGSVVLLLMVLVGNVKRPPVGVVIEVEFSDELVERTVELELAASCDDSAASVLLGSDSAGSVCDEASVVVELLQ